MLRVAVAAFPSSKVTRVQILGDDSLAVHVRARPVEGKANAAIERAIAEALQLRPRQVTVVAGGRARRKIVEIDLDDVNTIRERLVAHAVRQV